MSNRNDDDADTMTCLDGTTCQNGGSCKEGTEEGSFYCDCSTSPSKNAVFAGLFCEYKASVFCNEDNLPNDFSFCANGGKCKQLLADADDDAHAGCTCRPKYTGNFCEYVKGQTVPDDYGPATGSVSNSTSSNSTGAVGVAFIVIGLAVIVAAIAGLFVCRRRRTLFWSQHAIGPSKQATDMDLSVDGNANLPPQNKLDEDDDNEIKPTDSVEVFQDVNVDDDEMTDII
ncbi:hypothetical protein MPSEU_000239500 [Mayamaea pseudoterrestris]|nr:hypothetical protein MPSEU_000239500 [Mayamaea pseudoterrestris]